MYSSVQTRPLPEAALLAPYAMIEGGFTDCYAVDVPVVVSLADYVAAFYTTPLFRMERGLLAIALREPSQDAQAVELAAGARDSYSAWRVEARTEAQLLMCPLGERTRSWLMVEPQGHSTRLFFGSAVVPQGGGAGRGPLFRLLLGVHGVYSKALLASAARRLGA
ncbi:hypothetical protein [Pararhodobacter sp.]|uniref:hypothetical protein n=1 Tax=Pararhodobacter sp. TaxID=2127056 RepID=UPI002AFF9EA4|nr:hypothetical protein [Pararhodobacter sp.]